MTVSRATPTLGLALDPGADEPLYRQIFDQIVARIRSGTLPAGFRLPPTRVLAEDLVAHRNTVVRAYQDLEAAGFVTSTVGRGTFVVGGGRAPRLGAPPARRGLAWEALLSRSASAEALGRTEPFTRPASEVIDLSRMQPSDDLLPHELLQRCLDHVLRTEGARVLGYGAREGLPRLRGLIAEDLARQGVPTAAEDVVITSGSQQALDLVARTLVDPGDAFLVDEATYTGAIHLLAAAGARLVGVPADDEGPSLEALERHARAGAKGLYLMPNCLNPTGAIISATRRQALVAWSHASGVPLVEDNYAGDLHLDGPPAPPPLRALSAEVIHLGTFSKKLIPAFRVGFLVCPPALRPRLVALKHSMDLGTSPLLQHALAEFLERGYLRAHLQRTVAEYRARRDALARALRRHLPDGWSFQVPHHGLMIWLPTPAEVSPDRLCEEAERRGVRIKTGALHVHGLGRPTGVRITYCAEPTDRVALGGRRLGDAARALASRPGLRKAESAEMDIA